MSCAISASTTPPPISLGHLVILPRSWRMLCSAWLRSRAARVQRPSLPCASGASDAISLERATVNGMDWKTLATLVLGLAAGVVAVKVPEAKGIAEAVAGFCVGAVLPAVRGWGGAR
jgi:hypothetical protein